jgi:hypothetical protein
MKQIVPQIHSRRIVGFPVVDPLVLRWHNADSAWAIHCQQGATVPSFILHIVQIAHFHLTYHLDLPTLKLNVLNVFEQQFRSARDSYPL